MKTALITGITGQDGSYLADFLLKKKYLVHGLFRKSATGNTKNIDHIINNSKIFNKSFFLHKGDLLDAVSLNNVINKVQPSEIYNFADQDHVGWSYEIPTYSFRTTALSVIEILEILKKSKKKSMKSQILKPIKNVFTKKITVISNPPGAKVYVNDVLQGVTPITLEFKSNLFDFVRGFSVFVEKKGFLPARRKVDYNETRVIFNLFSRK